MFSKLQTNRSRNGAGLQDSKACALKHILHSHHPSSLPLPWSGFSTSKLGHCMCLSTSTVTDMSHILCLTASTVTEYITHFSKFTTGFMKEEIVTLKIYLCESQLSICLCICDEHTLRERKRNFHSLIHSHIATLA